MIVEDYTAYNQIYYCRLGGKPQPRTSVYDKQDFYVTKFTYTFPRSNILFSPAYDVFITQLIGYACLSYECFILRTGDFPVKYLYRDTSWNA